ncbi:MAG: type II secretion system protein [Oligoflexales bacterium]|nr:type II secretion system protein [Oligoflexales bacterium]
MSFRKQLKSQKGVSITEVIVALSIIGIAIAASNTYFGQVSKGKRKARLRDVQRRIATVIKNSLKSPADIYYTVSRHDKNPTLAGCVLGVALPGETGLNCTKALKKNVVNPLNPVQHEFGLFKITNASGIDGKALTNPERGKKVYYDINGKICDEEDDERCAFEADTDFFVTCNRDSSEFDSEEDQVEVDPDCHKGATQVFFSYQVRQKSGKFSLLGKEIPPYPKVRRYTSMSTTQILGPHRFSECGSGVPDLQEFDSASDRASFSSEFSEGFYATLVGYDEYGKAKCECVYPFVRVTERRDPKTGLMVPVCRILAKDELACNEDQYVRGVRDVDRDESGKGRKDLICVGEDSAFDCAVMGVYDDCPDGAWITQVSRNNCEFACEHKPDQVRTCTFQWFSSAGDSVPQEDDLDENVFGDFACIDRQLYCCQPSRYGSNR